MGRKSILEGTYEFFGGFATALAADVAAGATTIETTATLTAGMAVEVDVAPTTQGGAPTTPDIAFVQSVTGTGPYTATLKAPLVYAHSAGAIASHYRTSPSLVFPDLKTVLRGEPFEMLDWMQPVLYLTVPPSHEHRPYAQKKFVDYTIHGILTSLLTTLEEGDQGAVEINAFYSLLDQITNYIRVGGTGNPSDAKILKTTSYPQGAAIVFGENFTVEETHERVENSTFLVARLQIQAREMVNG